MKSLRQAGDANPIILDMMNNSINEKKRRYESYREYCYVDNKPRYAKASDALTQIMCEKVENANNGNKLQFQWPCVLKLCQNCREFEIHEEEKSLNQEDEIKFVHYLYHTRCTIHGLLGRELKQSETICTCYEDPTFLGKKVQYAPKRNQ